MNREIRFRGKRADKLNDNWVYGYLIIEPDGSGWIDHFPDGNRHTTEVILETVGQFTGLTDSKGNKVFEGDIESSGGVIKLGIYEMFSDRSGVPTWMAEKKNGASFVLMCNSEFKIRETIIGNKNDARTALKQVLKG